MSRDWDGTVVANVINRGVASLFDLRNVGFSTFTMNGNSYFNSAPYCFASSLL